jgi:hypothetical protein
MEINGGGTLTTGYKPVYPNSQEGVCDDCYQSYIFETSTDCDEECGPHNLAFKPYSYTTRSDNTGANLEYLLAGTTDMYQNVNPYNGDTIQDEWTRISGISHYNVVDMSGIITYNSITAYAYSDYNTDDDDWTTYFSTYRVRNMGIGGKEDPVKVVRSVVNLENISEPTYFSDDITP